MKLNNMCKSRSSPRRCSVKKGVLKFCNIHRKAPVLESLFNNAAGLKGCNFIEKKNPTQVFSYEYCEVSKNTNFEEHLRTDASANL